MKVNEAIAVIDKVIPDPGNKMVDLEHLEIAIAWKTLRRDALERDRRDNSLDAITLSRAFLLCGIREEKVYLRAFGDQTYTDHYFWSGRVRELLDMTKLIVTRIEPRFEPYGPDFDGMLFIVKGITAEELRKLSYRAANKGCHG